MSIKISKLKKLWWKMSSNKPPKLLMSRLPSRLMNILALRLPRLMIQSPSRILSLLKLLLRKLLRINQNLMKLFQLRLKSSKMENSCKQQLWCKLKLKLLKLRQLLISKLNNSQSLTQLLPLSSKKWHSNWLNKLPKKLLKIFSKPPHQLFHNKFLPKQSRTVFKSKMSSRQFPINTPNIKLKFQNKLKSKSSQTWDNIPSPMRLKIELNLSLSPIIRKLRPVQLSIE